MSVNEVKSESTTNPVEVSSFTWQGFSNTIHAHFMKKMGIALGSPEELYFLGLETAGEIGELANEIKKLWRDGFDNQERRAKLAKEIADGIIMLHHLCEALNLNPDEIAAAKIKELYARGKTDPVWAGVPYKRSWNIYGGQEDG